MVMLPLIRLRLPVIRASSALLIFIPENPEVNPNPKLPLFDTLSVVALLPGLSDPVKTKSLAVILRALLVVVTVAILFYNCFFTSEGNKNARTKRTIWRIHRLDTKRCFLNCTFAGALI